MRQILKILMLISMFSVFVVGCSKTETPIVPINQGIVAETVTESETESESVLETASEPVTSSALEGKSKSILMVISLKSQKIPISWKTEE